MTDSHTSSGKGPREVSTIAFPYTGLDEAIGVAKALLDKGGGIACERDQLAAAMGQSPGSGNFIIKIQAARLFGLIDSSSGKFQLTPIGFDILDQGRMAAAKATAFLSVPLYRRVYDEFKGKQLPPRPAGLENAFVQLGVSSKQKDKARHVFDRSARSAGYFPNAQEDRLVAPITGGAVALATPEKAQIEPEPAAYAPNYSAPSYSPPGYGRAYAPPSRPLEAYSLNPFVEGLLKKLPDEGSEWTLEGRKRWLEAASHIFNLIYEGNEPNRLIEIEIGEI